jgi:hypothetical protein
VLQPTGEKKKIGQSNYATSFFDLAIFPRGRNVLYFYIVQGKK